MFARRSNPAAFTLIELLMVMAIVAIMAAVVAPRLTGFAVGRTNNDAGRMIVSLARYARTQAISEGRVYRLNFDESSRQFWLTAQNAGQFDALTNDYGQKYTVPDGVTIDAQFPQQADKTGEYVEFQPSGRAQAAQIRLTDKLGKVVEVAAASATELFRVVPAAEVTR